MRDGTAAILVSRSRMDEDLPVARIQEGSDVQGELQVLADPVESPGTSLVLTEACACA